MHSLNPVCCICRHDEVQNNAVLPIITVLTDLSKQLNAQFDSSLQKISKVEKRFLKISRDFHEISLLCETFSQQSLESLSNYKSMILRESDKDVVSSIIDDIVKTDNYD